METGITNIHIELIELCKEGDRTAQMKIYKLYYKAMYNTSLRILNNVYEAEDVMQESFLDAFRNLGNYRAEVAFGSWLKKIVINKSISVIRKRKLFEPLDESFESIEDQDNESFSETKYYKIELIKDAFDQLDESSKIILSLHLIEGYNHKEIAESFGITHTAVRTRFVRAKQKLLEIMNRKATNLIRN